MEIDPAELAGWVPIRLSGQGLNVYAEWCYLTSGSPREPFFDQTIETCLRNPFNQVFLRHTPIDVLGSFHEAYPGIAPSGFVFHMSRCGSTLISQVLCTLPHTVVISEADPIHWILRAQPGDPLMTAEVRRRWLRWVFSTLAQRWTGVEKHLVVKFDSFSIIDLALIRAVFPRVPWVFAYRDPIEVMVSQMRRRGSHAIPSAYGARLLDLDLSAAARIPSEEYCARVLARICKCAVDCFDPPRSALVEFRELPAAIWTKVLDFFQIECSRQQREQMRAQAQLDAKNPAVRFVSDSLDKKREASPLVRAMTERWLAPVCRELDRLRASSENVLSAVAD
jgi:hypothetical protein